MLEDYGNAALTTCQPRFILKYKTMLIKILPDSIRRNPNAGRSTINVPSNLNCTFTIKGKVPDKWIEGEDYIIDEESNTEIKGTLLRPKAFDEFIQLPNISITKSMELQTIHTHPEPSYFYLYENPKLECDNCKAKVHLSQIEIDYVDDGEGSEYRCEFCPVCKACNTFPEVQYQNLSDALKDKAA